MKISIFGISNKSKNQTVKTIELSELIDLIKANEADYYVYRYRDDYEYLKAIKSDFGHLNDIKDVCVAAEYYRKTSGMRALRVYNGIIAVEVHDLSNQFEVDAIKHQSALLPQTMAAFEGVDGHSVVVLVRATLPDGSLPKAENDQKLFHAEAYRVAVLCFTPTFSHPITIKEPKLDATFKMTFDANPYVNDNAIPFIIEQPKAAINVQTMVQGGGKDNPLERLKPGSESIGITNHIFNACLRHARDIMYERKLKRTPLDEVRIIAEVCAEGGLPEEEATQRLLWHYYKEDDSVVRDIVRTVYYDEENIGSTSFMPKKQQVAFRLREFLKRRYDIRHNEVLDITEYRVRHSFDFMYRELSKRDRNTIRYEAALEGIEAFDSEINGLIDSNYTLEYNPIMDYLNSVGKWDGRDRIGEVAAMVPCNNADWSRLFTRWFLSMVAHWMGYDPDHGNSTAPILVGEQGFRKSTFCRVLLPPELRGFFADSVDFRTKIEAERMLSRFLLINIDEFDQLSEQQMGFVKHLFQKPSTNSRDMYSTTYTQKHRYASFIGTSNHQDILRDTTGNRRFLCIVVTAPIKVETAIDYRQLYAQAVSMIHHGERYWINDEDEALIKAANKDFEVQSPLELLISDLYSKPGSEDEYVVLRPIDIIQIARKHPAFNRKEMDSMRKLGRVLTKMGFEKIRRNDGIYYKLKKRNSEDILH